MCIYIYTTKPTIKPTQPISLSPNTTPPPPIDPRRPPNPKRLDLPTKRVATHRSVGWSVGWTPWPVRFGSGLQPNNGRKFNSKFKFTPENWVLGNSQKERIIWTFQPSILAGEKGSTSGVYNLERVNGWVNSPENTGFGPLKGRGIWSSKPDHHGVRFDSLIFRGVKPCKFRRFTAASPTNHLFSVPLGPRSRKKTN